MMDHIKRMLSGRKPREAVEAREREITHLRHEFKNSVQAVQRLLQTMSGVIDLNKRSTPR